jgi:hypothetical protein
MVIGTPHSSVYVVSMLGDVQSLEPPPELPGMTRDSRAVSDATPLPLGAMLTLDQGGGRGPMICRLAPPTPRPAPPLFWLSPPM